MTKKQIEALAWLASDCRTAYRLDSRVWNALKSKGFVTQRAGMLTITQQGRAALRLAKEEVR